MIQTISSLKSAVIALSKHNAAFIQMDSDSDSDAGVTMEALQVVTQLKHTLKKHADDVKQMFTPKQQKKLSAFVQNKNGYAPASGEIFGMLQQMKETFETNLANSQKEEATDQADYESLKAAKES